MSAVLPDSEGITIERVQIRPDLALNAARLGPADGALIVLLHGFPEFWWSWRKTMRALAHAGFLAVAPDLRGYGDSDKPTPGTPEGRYDVATLAEDAKLLIETLQTARGRTGEPAVVIAHDWGGAVAWAMPALFPKVVAKLAILNAPHPMAFRRSLWRHPSQLFKSWYIFMFQVPGLAERAILKDPVSMMARTFLSAAGNRKAFGRQEFEVYGAAIARPGVLPCALAYYRSMTKALGYADKLAAPIACPVLVLWGERDPALGSYLAQEAKQWCTGPFAVQLYPEAGHWLQQESPEPVNAALVQFAAG